MAKIVLSTFIVVLLVLLYKAMQPKDIICYDPDWQPAPEFAVKVAVCEGGTRVHWVD